MANFEEFRLQCRAIGMRPQGESTLEGVWQKAQDMAGQDEVDLSDPSLASLWEDLRPEQIDLDWPKSEYEPEKALQKRALFLGGEAVEILEGDFSSFEAEKMNEQWEHLFLHGKLGLMSALFAFEQHHRQLTMKEIAPVVERFMDVIEKAFEDLLRRKDREAIAKSLRLILQPELSFDDFIFGRFQAFSVLRGLYLEDQVAAMRPLEWWVVHERYIPDLPSSRTI